MPSRIMKLNPVTQIHRTMEFTQYTQEEFDIRLASYINGEKSIDDAFPLLSNRARDFITTGMVDEDMEIGPTGALKYD